MQRQSVKNKSTLTLLIPVASSSHVLLIKYLITEVISSFPSYFWLIERKINRWKTFKAAANFLGCPRNLTEL